MPLTIEEASSVFRRRAGEIIETADAIKLGLQVQGQLIARVKQLEQTIANAGLQVPPPPGYGPVPLHQGGVVNNVVNIAGAKDPNVKEFPTPPPPPEDDGK